MAPAPSGPAWSISSGASPRPTSRPAYRRHGTPSSKIRSVGRWGHRPPVPRWAALRLLHVSFNPIRLKDKSMQQIKALQRPLRV
ncbi:hypothetical protein GOC60_28970 [Sinorhizobium meliloti]|nr:hypothetical protein [Sinorhizobium meliloti]MDX0352452.1 hypothetical protein [Sinorhizobium meliloti]